MQQNENAHTKHEETAWDHIEHSEDDKPHQEGERDPVEGAYTLLQQDADVDRKVPHWGRLSYIYTLSILFIC